jgi:plasmid stabilization system protein ParE
MAKVIWADSAIQDLDATADYIALEIENRARDGKGGNEAG